MKILIFGGTTEGRILAEKLCAEGHKVTVSCATGLGIEELGNVPCDRIRGRLDEDEIEKLVVQFELVVDATHPYAAIVTANIRLACVTTGTRLERVLREGGEYHDCVSFKNCRDAADFLCGTEGNIMLTTGAKELPDFKALPPERLYARVLPTHLGISACENAGIPHRNIIAMQGPFPELLNEAMFRRYDIKWIVTKNSGKAGGFTEKTEAAKNTGAAVILIEPPDDSGISMEELLRKVREACM